ncbi:hypothetical protein CC86DRAFT_403790 [Ophiobolus disseminans]|uniref:Uncharacterized protein n=1 Tax=Ophiobolus disseminans TaxID=1469910 RepID=A0A6A7A8V6_9PLEO|nr:hypothetical protein CC86DRAFT_403790 [Ophiobolus disseminans]
MASASALPPAAATQVLETRTQPMPSATDSPTPPNIQVAVCGGCPPPPARPGCGGYCPSPPGSPIRNGLVPSPLPRRSPDTGGFRGCCVTNPSRARPDPKAEELFTEMLKLAMRADPRKAEELKEEWEREYGPLEDRNFITCPWYTAGGNEVTDTG